MKDLRSTEIESSEIEFLRRMYFEVNFNSTSVTGYLQKIYALTAVVNTENYAYR